MTGPGGGPGMKEGGEKPDERERGKRDKPDGNDKSNREERKHHDKSKDDHKKDEKKEEKDNKPKGKPYDPSNREMHEGLKPYDVPKSPRMPTGGGGTWQMAETKELPNPGGRKELKDEMDERAKKLREESARQLQAQRRLTSRL